MKLGLVLLFTLLFTLSTNADEVNLKNRFGLGAGIGFAVPIAHTALTDSASTGFSLDGHFDYFLSNSWSLEGSYNLYDFSNTGSPKSNNFGMGANYRFCPDSIISPVIGIGIAYSSTSRALNTFLDYDNVSVNGKLGLDYMISSDLMLSINAKYAWLFSKGSQSYDEHLIIPQLTFTYFLQNTKPQSKSEAIIDGDDDGDGVPNSMDKCPNTPKAVKVNSFGCPIEDKVDFLLDVQFESGQTSVKSEYRNELLKMAEILKTHSDMKAEIQGYTDNSGIALKNIKLSQTRANSVMNYIIKEFGVSASQLTAKGFGSDNPVSANTTAEGRAKNRRVIASLRSK